MKRGFSGILLAIALAAGPARATGFSDYREDLQAPRDRWFEIDGYFRARGSLYGNLDLDRGASPSGQTLFPVSPTDPKAQILSAADMRLRTDLTAYWPDGGAAVKVRLDALDNVALGSGARGIPSASSGYAPGTVAVKRAYGEVLTPVGLFAVGRMGNDWGLGILANGGDCYDCDSGDAADRIAFITPIAGHLWAAAYDLTAIGPFVPSRSAAHAIDVAPSAMVHTVTAAILRYQTDATRRRRRAAGRFTGEYGAYVSHRWQKNDIPASYLPTAQPVAIDASQQMARGFTATAVDLWLRVSGPLVHIEAEGAILYAAVQQASLVPGASFHEPVTSLQFGAALESLFGDRERGPAGGVDGGFASGDRAPGFGAFPALGQTAPRAGDIDGPQAAPPRDTTVDNFRFHPDYRVDRILFRELIGTVTDAFYLKPHIQYRISGGRRGALTAEVAAIASFAVFAESTPGGKQPLGIEIDPTLRYDSRVGFLAALEQATLVPLAGLDNPAAKLDAKPAQLWRLRMVYAF